MSKSPTPSPLPTPGRPRNPRATRAILRAALELAAESGFDALTIEGIAARAGVAKTTVYRRWPGVWPILADAVLADVDQYAPLRERGTARESLHEAMRQAARYFTSKRGRVLRALIGRAQLDDALHRALIEQWLQARRAITRGYVQRGIELNEIRADVDPDLVIDVLFGPLYHHLLLPYHESRRATLPEAYLDALIDVVFAGLAPR